jgi:hypothetical protein
VLGSAPKSGWLFGQVDEAREAALARQGGRDLQEPLLSLERLVALDLTGKAGVSSVPKSTTAFRPLQRGHASARRVSAGARAVPHSVLEQVGEPLQVERPAALTADALAEALPALTVAPEVAVLELDPRPLRRFGDEAHLDLAGLR